MTHSEGNTQKIPNLLEPANPEEKAHMCTEGEVTYHRADQLQRHILNHWVIKSVKCTDSPFIYDFITQQDLQTQIRIHRKETHNPLEEEIIKILSIGSIPFVTVW